MSGHEAKEGLGLQVRDRKSRGIKVSLLLGNSPAEVCEKLVIHDRILEIDGMDVRHKSAADVQPLLDSCRAGDTRTLTFTRDGERVFTITLTGSHYVRTPSEDVQRGAHTDLSSDSDGEPRLTPPSSPSPQPRINIPSAIQLPPELKTRLESPKERALTPTQYGDTEPSVSIPLREGSTHSSPATTIGLGDVLAQVSLNSSQGGDQSMEASKNVLGSFESNYLDVPLTNICTPDSTLSHTKIPNSPTWPSLSRKHNNTTDTDQPSSVRAHDAYGSSGSEGGEDSVTGRGALSAIDLRATGHSASPMKEDSPTERIPPLSSEGSEASHMTHLGSANSAAPESMSTTSPSYSRPARRTERLQSGAGARDTGSRPHQAPHTFSGTGFDAPEIMVQIPLSPGLSASPVAGDTPVLAGVSNTSALLIGEADLTPFDLRGGASRLRRTLSGRRSSSGAMDPHHESDSSEGDGAGHHYGGFHALDNIDIMNGSAGGSGRNNGHMEGSSTVAHRASPIPHGERAPHAVEVREQLSDGLWESLRCVRASRPLIHCITNYVSMDIIGSGLTAVGACPAMIHAQEEVKEAVALVSQHRGALYCNIGTLSDTWIESLKKAVAAARDKNVVWVLDPIATGFTDLRTQTVLELLQINTPSVIAANEREIFALAIALKEIPADEVFQPSAVMAAAKTIAVKRGCIVAIFAETDRVTNGTVVLEVHHSSRMQQVVAAARSLSSALIATFVAARARHTPVLMATVHALAFWALCCQHSLSVSHGPGTFRTSLIDCLSSIDHDHF